MNQKVAMEMAGNFLKKMKLIPLLTILMIFAACSSETPEDALSSVPKTTSKSSKQIETAFNNAKPTVKTLSDKLIKAYEEGNLSEAATTIVYLENNPELTFEQGMTIRNSRAALEENLARGVQSGDPKAIEAFKRLKGSNPPQ